MAKELRISLLGHKDHGKSTLIGRLLFDTRSITEDRINEARATARSLGKDFEYAFLLDSFEEEREEGFTLDTTRAQVRHNDAIYELIDVPGHKELVKNMLSGASLANAAILIVSARPEERLRDETKLHLYLAKLLGIGNLVVAINKMDAVSYSNDEFGKIRGEVGRILEDFGFDDVSFVPVSAMEGDNVSESSANMPWYDGKTVLQHMEGFADIDYEGRLVQLPPRMFVQDVYGMGGGQMLVGRLESGRLRVGQELTIQPKGISGRISRIVVRNRDVEEALAGENVGIMLEAGGSAARGDLCLPAGSGAAPAKTVSAKIFCLPGNGISLSEKIGITCASAESGSQILSIEGKMNPIHENEMKNGGSEVHEWEAAEVTIGLDSEMVFEKFAEMPFTGIFILTKNGRIAAVGVVI
jgi:translation elongation factor EF-1alpha